MTIPFIVFHVAASLNSIAALNFPPSIHGTKDVFFDLIGTSLFTTGEKGMRVFSAVKLVV